MPWELSEEDMERDTEDAEALDQLERAEEGSNEDYPSEEEDEVSLSTL